MNKTKLIIKGMMVWITILSTLLFITGIDSIYDNGYFFQTLIVIVMMIFCCYKLISEEEFEILILSKWFNNKLNTIDTRRNKQ